MGQRALVHSCKCVVWEIDLTGTRCMMLTSKWISSHSTLTPSICRMGSTSAVSQFEGRCTTRLLIVSRSLTLDPRKASGKWKVVAWWSV